MGKAQSSFLRVEPFAALFRLPALNLPPPNPARWPGDAPPWYRLHVHCPLMVMLLVLRWRLGSTLKEAHYFAHLGVINLYDTRCYSWATQIKKIWRSKTLITNSNLAQLHGEIL